MKRYFIAAAVALLALANQHADAAIAAACSASGTNCPTATFSSTTGSVTFTNAVATGSVVGVIVTIGTTTPTAPSSVTDTNSDTLITGIALASSGGGEGSFGIYLFNVGTGGSSFKVTVNFASSVSFRLIGFNYTGVNSTPVDKAGVLYHGNSTAPATTASLTPTQTGDEQIAVLISPTASTVSAWGDSLTQEASQTTGFNSYYADALLSGTSAVNSGATLGSSGTWNIAQILLAPGAGGSSCTHPGRTQAATIAVPTASSTVMWREDGNMGTVPCTGSGASNSYWQTSTATWGVN